MNVDREIRDRASLLHQALADLDCLPTRCLQAIQWRLRRCRDDNCWYAEYELAPLMLREIKSIFYGRKQARKRKRRASPTPPEQT